MKLLVCGSRRMTSLDFDIVKAEIEKFRPSLIIEGGAEGADHLAWQVAIELDIPYQEYKANWVKHMKSAGAIRNQKMLDKGKPDHVLAFPAPDSKGTWDMVNKAKKAGVPVTVVNINWSPHPIGTAA